MKITFDEMPGLINMLISNTSNEVSEKLSTSKENAYAHGFGIKSIKEIVKKYNGAFSYCYKKGIFRVSILLCDSKING